MGGGVTLLRSVANSVIAIRAVRACKNARVAGLMIAPIAAARRRPELDQDAVGAARMTQSPDITYIPSAPRIFLAHSRGDRLSWLAELPDGERRQKAKPPVAAPPDGLRTPAEAA